MRRAAPSFIILPLLLVGCLTSHPSQDWYNSAVALRAAQEAFIAVSEGEGSILDDESKVKIGEALILAKTLLVQAESFVDSNPALAQDKLSSFNETIGRVKRLYFLATGKDPTQ